MRALKRLNAWINDYALRDVDPKLYITEIYEPAADATLEWGAVPGVSGQRLLRRTRQSKRIRIEFDIRELFDLTGRAAIITAVNDWAKDGILKVSYRPRQQMRVILADPAVIDGARDVSAKFEVAFQAGADPYWQDDQLTTVSLSGTAGTGTVIVPGQVNTWPEITVTPSASTLNALTLSINGQTMAFTGLGVESGTALTIGHDDRGLLQIKAGATSKLSCRTAASVDDFLIAPGSGAVAMAADVSSSVVFGFRGRYL